MSKAAVCVDFSKPLEIQDVEVRQPGPGEVLIKMEASGICHTDLHSTRGDWPVKSPLPFIAGHEGVGIIEAVGRGHDPQGRGTRVRALARLRVRSLPLLRAGWETLCPNQIQNGFARDGAFAEYAVVDGNWCGLVPERCRRKDAAPWSAPG